MKRFTAAALVAVLLGVLLALATIRDLAPLPAALPGGPQGGPSPPPRILAADGTVLTRSYGEAFNRDDWRALSRIPPLVREAFIAAEDRRFHQHAGPDWRARLRAAVQNLRAGRVVSGASTISEQVVRMLHPRPRGLWARWLEGFDAARAERRYGKAAMLEFYLNQVPYAARRRGVVQAARWTFGRDLDTLTVAEALALAVMVRAPSRLTPGGAPRALEWRIRRLAEHLVQQGRLSRLPELSLDASSPGGTLDVTAPDFLRFVRERGQGLRHGALRTTLFSAWQREAEGILAARLAQLEGLDVDHAAALLVEHGTGAIRAWAVATRGGLPGTRIDVARSPRQPGSTLKPFVYALALEDGSSPRRLLLDAPLSERVGAGLHAYRNYSRRFHGSVELRTALGSSLNVPAVRLLSEVGPGRVLERLGALGVTSLSAHPSRYGDGLALGNGALTLFELVQAYAGVARGGRRVTLCALPVRCRDTGERVFPAPVAARLTEILADPEARRLEFGSGGALTFDRPTAVKTGTSSDHRDAWALGYDGRHVAGVWLGNLDQRPMRGVSGAGGPAMALRSLLAMSRRHGDPPPLYPRALLAPTPPCSPGACGPGIPLEHGVDPSSSPSPAPLRILHPSHGLRIALDPRVPRERQRFRFRLAPDPSLVAVRWHLDGRRLAHTPGPDLLWRLQPGAHRLTAEILRSGNADWQTTPAVPFVVLDDGRGTLPELRPRSGSVADGEA